MKLNDQEIEILKRMMDALYRESCRRGVQHGLADLDGGANDMTILQHFRKRIGEFEAEKHQPDEE